MISHVGESKSELAAVDLGLIALVGLLVRLYLISSFPAIHGGDSVAMLAHSDTLILANQLPLPQLLVVVTRWLAPDPLWTRLVFAVVGALVPLALALAMAPVLGPLAARIGAVLASFHPLLLHYSTVPYPEGPMLLFLLLGAACLLRSYEGLAALFVGLACLCRYEAWIAAGLIILDQRSRLLRAVLLFGWAPLLWTLAWRGLSPSGTYALDLDPLARHWPRIPYLLVKLREYSGDALLALGLTGAVFLGRRRDRPLFWGLAFLTGFLTMVFTAGHEFSPRSGLVSERLTHIPAVFLCASAGVAAAAFMEGNAASSAANALRQGAVALGLALVSLTGVWHGAWLAAEANADPSLHAAHDVARLADALLPPRGRLFVVAPSVPASLLADYVAKIERSGGDALRAARLAHELAGRSPDADRIAAHLARPPATVVARGSPADLTAIFDDATDPTPPPGAVAISRLPAGHRSVRLYRTSASP